MSTTSDQVGPGVAPQKAPQKAPQAGPEAEFERFRATGDAQALGYVFDELSPRLLTLAGRLAKNAVDAEDLLQSTFLKAIEHRDRWDAGRPLLPWLAGILHHRAYDQGRRQRVRATVPLLRYDSFVDVSCDPQELASLEDDRSAVLAAVGSLGEPYGELFSLRIEKGLSNQDLAKVLHRPEGTVRVQLARGRERLEALLPKELRLAGVLLVQRDALLGRMRVDVVGQAAMVSKAASGAMGLGAAGLALIGPAWLVPIALALVLGLGLGLWSSFRPRTSQGSTPQQVAALTGTGSPAASADVKDGISAPAGGPSTRSTLRAATDASKSLQVPVPDGVDVMGSALSFDGSPIAGADIYRFDPLEPFAFHRLGRTDEKGQYALVDVAPGVELFARATGHQPAGGRNADSRHRVRGAAGSSLQIDFQFGARGHPVEGRVLGPDGQPAAFAHVVIAVEEDARDEPDGLEPLSWAELQEPTVSGKYRDTDSFLLCADAEGLFRTEEIPRGTVSFLARSPKDPALVGSTMLDVLGEDVAHVTLHLGRGAEVYGRVLDSQGRPRVGVPLEAVWKGTTELGGFEEGFGERATLVRTTTGEDGNYSLVGLLPGSTALRYLIGTVHTPKAERVVLQSHQRLEWNPEIPVHTEIHVRGVDADGLPLVGWEVRCSWVAQAVRISDSLVLDSEGRARFKGLRGEQRVVTLHPPGVFHAESATVPVAHQTVYPSDEELVLRFDPGRSCSVAGSIRLPGTDPGESPSCKLQLMYRDFDTCGVRIVRAGERFEFGDLPAGDYRMEVSAPTAGVPRGVQLAAFTLRTGESVDLGELKPAQGTKLVIDVISPVGGKINDRALALNRPADAARLPPFSVSKIALRRASQDEPFRSEPLQAGAYLATYQDQEHGIQSRLFHVRSSASDQREVWEFEQGLPVSWAIHFDRHPTTEHVRPRCESSEGKVDINLWDEFGNILWEPRLTQALDGTGDRVMTVSQRLGPGSYRLSVEDERFDGWDKPFTFLDFDVLPGTGAQFEVHLDEGR